MAAPAVIAEVDFSGRTIELLVPFREGGGSDTWARFNAPFLARYLPGQPTIVVRNHPGGGSIVAANRYAAAPPLDGLSLFMTSASTQFPFLLGDSRVRYDYAAWQPLMAYRTGGVVYINPGLGVSSVAELGALDGVHLAYGSQGTTSLDLVPLLAFKLLGLKVRPIFGVRGRSAGRLAFEKGQANIDFQTSAAYLSSVVPLVEAGRAVPLFSLGTLDDTGRLVRDPAFPELPHVGEVYAALRGHAARGIEWEAWLAFFTAGFGAQKFLVLPDETPANIVAAYRRAIQQMLSDPEYVAARFAVIGAYEQLEGEPAARLYIMATQIPDAPKRWVLDWLRKAYKVNI